MNIDTQTIRRLRDALIEHGRLSELPNGTSESPSSDASINRVAPFVETMYLVMAADGHHDEGEVAVIRGAMRTLAGNSVADADFEALLQADPVADMVAMRNEQNAVLDSYGWVDKEKGVVRIPIEKAIELTLEHSLVRSQITDTTPAVPEATE